MLLAATFQFADGTKYRGFASPPDIPESHPSSIGTIQPTLFTKTGEMIGFWLGMFPLHEQIDDSYQILGKTSEQIFPIQFAVNAGIVQDEVEEVIEVFYSIPDGSDAPVKIEN